MLSMMACPAFSQETVVKDPNGEVAAFERYDSENSPPKGAVLFAGSSSINLWQTGKAFPGIEVINRGFGGSTAEELYAYREKLIFKYEPSVVVIYAGENDINVGTPPSMVISTLKALIDSIHDTLPRTCVLYLPVKASSSRWSQIEGQRTVNAALLDLSKHDDRLQYIDIASVLLGADHRPNDRLFAADRLHLNSEGYALWNEKVGARLKELALNRKPARCD